MAEVSMYHPVIGYDREIVVHPSPPTWIPKRQHRNYSLRPISPFRHILGTDPLGRDVLSQLMYSTQSEFALGIMASLVTVLIATTLGAVAAYYGGFVDMIFMRIADVMFMLPLYRDADRPQFDVRFPDDPSGDWSTASWRDLAATPWSSNRRR